MPLLLLIIIGFLPSFIWLLFYLRRDQHPESNKMVLTVFVWGVLMAPLALIIEMILGAVFSARDSKSLVDLLTQPLWLCLINVALVPALVEEFLKYQVVKQKVLVSSHFDEPIDVMLYMVIAALGFAGIENFSQALGLYLDGRSSWHILGIIAIRFVGATLLHTLASGIFGYFIALSLHSLKIRLRLLGFGFACLIHFCYNGMIVLIEKTGQAWEAMPQLSTFLLSISFFWVIALIAFLVVLGIVNLVLFEQLKKRQSTCQTA